MSKDLFESAYSMLTARLRWETRQRTFYTMRHDGLPRLPKPFPGAADGHYPAIDMALRRLKPFWIGQVTAGDKLANFTSLQPQLDSLSDAAAAYFDFLLTQRTKFVRKLRTAIDHMLLRGRGVMKATVDPMDGYALVFEAVDPMFILMPQEADSFEDADEWVHVRQFTVDSYKRLDGRWNTDPALINRIRGQPMANLQAIMVQKKLQEGITSTTNERQILVYEHWVKTSDGHEINTYSPHVPEEPLRQSHRNPYKFQGRESVPFQSFQVEVKDEGWFSPRGVAELLGPVEQYLTKLWNEKADAMTFANRPLYTGEKEIQNLANYRWQPGEYIPGNIRGVQQSSPPFSFDNEINFARQIGEQQSQSPDFGISDPGSDGNKPRTATENNRISALQQTGVSDGGNLFREDLSRLYQHIWGMICQYKERDFAYYAAGEVKQLPKQVVHDAYLIAPDGSPDGWNRVARLQKAISLAQTTNGVPFVNPEPIWREVLAAYGDNMVQKAFVPSNQRGLSEYEDQAQKINSLLVPGSGKPPFPVTVKPQDDHASRIKANIDWLHAAGKLGVPLDPRGAVAIQQNTAQHIAMLREQNPAAAKDVTLLIQQMEMAGQPAAQPRIPGMETAPNGMPLPEDQVAFGK